MRRLLPRALALASVAALLGACSTLDASKPGSWIDTIAGGGSETGGEAKTAPPPPSAGDKPPVTSATSATTTRTASSTAGTTSSTSDQPKPSALPSEKADGAVDYPNLNNQPDLQTSGTTDSQRREIRDSLVQDREEAQHSADVLRGGTEKPAAPPPAAPPASDKPADAAATDAKPAEGSDTPASTQ
jgi:hypothetical protein